MVLMACVDERMGMLFNRRRQSRDQAVCRDMLEQAGDAPLWVTPYTAKLFAPEDAGQLQVCEAFGPEAGLCFCEDPAHIPGPEQLERIVLYRWNRTYPFDASFPFPLPGAGWRLESSGEFPGSSHETITKEVYVPCAG
ncbi:MAG: ribonuclease Z [Lawsonibacter sp.]|nr:ribonuclease Z [Lawsonibacter sp.]